MAESNSNAELNVK